MFLPVSFTLQTLGAQRKGILGFIGAQYPSHIWRTLNMTIDSHQFPHHALCFNFVHRIFDCSLYNTTVWQWCAGK